MTSTDANSLRMSYSNCVKSLDSSSGKEEERGSLIIVSSCVMVHVESTLEKDYGHVLVYTYPRSGACADTGRMYSSGTRPFMPVGDKCRTRSRRPALPFGRMKNDVDARVTLNSVYYFCPCALSRMASPPGGPRLVSTNAIAFYCAGGSNSFCAGAQSPCSASIRARPSARRGRARQARASGGQDGGARLTPRSIYVVHVMIHLHLLTSHEHIYF